MRPDEPARARAGIPLLPVDAAFEEIVAAGTDAVREVEPIPVHAAPGRVLAEDVRSPMDLPPFDNAAMDGYGAGADAIGLEPPFSRRLAGHRHAGTADTAPLEAGEAVRLLTGAPVPPGVETILFQERCSLSGDRVTFLEGLHPGRNIRRRGEDIAARDLAVAGGTVLDVRHLAVFSALGLETVAVRRRIRVGVLSMGDELVDAGWPLSAGRIHDANRPMLAGLLAAPFVELTDLGIARDDDRAIAERLRHGMDLDLVVASGGVAGSERDRLAHGIAALGGTSRNFRLAMKPGKPLVTGCLDGTRLLGLPGNPLAAFVGALLFVRPLIMRLGGLDANRPRGIPARLAEPERAPGKRTEFAPARWIGFDEHGASVVGRLGSGGSARLLPLATADGLLEIPPGSAGTRISFHPFCGMPFPGGVLHSTTGFVRAG